jgi:hypothetical protein
LNNLKTILECVDCVDGDAASDIADAFLNLFKPKIAAATLTEADNVDAISNTNNYL